MGRYDGRRKITNANALYEEMLEKRGIKKVTQYSSPQLKYPPPEKIAATLKRVGHVWKHGDKFWKLASEFYGDAQLWWVIAWFNKKPTEAHLKLGDRIQIPMPLTTVMKYLRSG
jgi:nucleoid-associated protein YgaU|tara:strand:- start:1497 stop:1838 length:342 start_codon:yes stop_codon:yes gene_type:complete